VEAFVGAKEWGWGSSMVAFGVLQWKLLGFDNGNFLDYKERVLFTWFEVKE